jgi:chorismate lyase
LNQYVPQSSRLEPNWIEERQLRLTQVPATTCDWLSDHGSLTARLKRSCPGRFRVRVISQGRGNPLYSEGQLLRMRRGEAAIVREVELLCDEVPWVFARTVIPVTSLRGPARRLTMLGSKPLGEVLFADPRTRRVVMEMARLHARHRMFHAAVAGLEAQPDELWGRRTLFRLDGAPLLVNELFLPAVGGE